MTAALLERGDWLPREPENWSTADVFVDGRYISEDTWYDEKAKAEGTMRRFPLAEACGMQQNGLSPTMQATPLGQAEGRLR